MALQRSTTVKLILLALLALLIGGILLLSYDRNIDINFSQALLQTDIIDQTGRSGYIPYFTETEIVLVPASNKIRDAEIYYLDSTKDNRRIKKQLSIPKGQSYICSTSGTFVFEDRRQEILEVRHGIQDMETNNVCIRTMQNTLSTCKDKDSFLQLSPQKSDGLCIKETSLSENRTIFDIYSLTGSNITPIQAVFDHSTQEFIISTIISGLPTAIKVNIQDFSISEITRPSGPWNAKSLGLGAGPSIPIFFKLAQENVVLTSDGTLFVELSNKEVKVINNVLPKSVSLSVDGCSVFYTKMQDISRRTSDLGVPRRLDLFGINLCDNAQSLD